MERVDNKGVGWLLVTDGELVQAILAGKRHHFATIVERYQRDIYNLAYRSTDNRHDAEDITQDTFLRAFRALSQYDARRSLRTWLYAIAANICRDRVRRRATRPQTVSLLPDEAPSHSDDFLSKDARPDDVVVGREGEACVRRAVLGLPPDYRIPVILFYMRNLPQAEIAEIMGVPVTVVKNRLYRARRKLQSELGGVVGDEGG